MIYIIDVKINTILLCKKLLVMELILFRLLKINPRLSIIIYI